ncbi:MAG: ROK family protein [Candidatus Ornithospirochaeta sp.]
MESSIGNNLPRIKVKNQFSIKEIIYKFGPISRIEISERLGLTLPTITTSVSSMIKNGLLKEVEMDNAIKSLGRRTMLVDINEKSRRFLGIEVRGTARSAVIVDGRGNVVGASRDEKATTDYDVSMESAASIASSLLKENGFSWNDINGVGIAIPGIVDNSQGTLVIHPGYKWQDRSIKEDFMRLSGCSCPITVENNTIARAYGLVMYEGKVLEDADSMAYMFISTGIGCPLLNNIRSHFGAVTGDGEVGHMVMEMDGKPCVCGNNGCLEAYSSEKTILESARVAASDNSDSILAQSLKDGHEIRMEDVIDAARRGDETIRRILDSAVKYLGLAVANIENFVKPECIVIEGKLFDEEEYRKVLLDVIRRNLYRATYPDMKFYFKKSDEYSGAKGASAVAVKRDLEAFLE